MFRFSWGVSKCFFVFLSVSKCCGVLRSDEGCFLGFLSIVECCGVVRGVSECFLVLRSVF